MMRPKRDVVWTILFDLDETLMPNGYLYRLAEAAALVQVQRALAPRCAKAIEVLQYVERVGRDLYREMGFSKERFPTSWTMGYELYCQEFGRAVDPDMREAVYRAAAGFQRGPFKFFPGVSAALRRLRRAGHELHVVTAGDQELQMSKAKSLGLSELVASINVVSCDKEPVFRRLSAATSKPAVVVGDSLWLDIAPAKAAGLKAVQVEAPGGFEMEDVNAIPDATIRSVTELQRLLPSLV